jgi:hypothetical protein
MWIIYIILNNNLDALTKSAVGINIIYIYIYILPFIIYFKF